MQQDPNSTHQTWMKSITERIKIICVAVAGWFKFAFGVFSSILCRLLVEIHIMELLFTNMYIIYAFLCQLLFLTMCEIALIGDPKESVTPNEQQGIVGLSALLFYSVFGYFVAKIKDICQSDWSRSVQMQYSFTNYVKWILRIALEWAKAIAVVLCIRDKGITYQPGLLYSAITFSYYICTERLFVNLLVKFVSYFKFQRLDSMEHLYVPIVLNVYVILCAAGISVYLAKNSQIAYALFSSYFVLYLRCKDLYYNYIKELVVETKTYASFRNATEKDIQKWDDICAVCLNSMSKALITPCNHLFHPFCLKQCLRSSLQCPLCKCDFIQ